MLGSTIESRAGYVGRVYVVDDDTSVRRSLVRLLRAEGIEVEDFGSAEDFLARAAPLPGGCLVLDEDLGGMSGHELADLLEHRGLDLRILFITATGREDSRRRTLHKPFTADMLFDAVRRVTAAI